MREGLVCLIGGSVLGCLFGLGGLVLAVWGVLLVLMLPMAFFGLVAGLDSLDQRKKRNAPGCPRTRRRS
jgi:hypothetical protein